MTDSMTDPWADVLERLENPTYGYQDSGGATTDGRKILADADALLTVARAAQKMGGAYTRETIQAAWDQHLVPALAALPEYLK